MLAPFKQPHLIRLMGNLSRSTLEMATKAVLSTLLDYESN